MLAMLGAMSMKIVLLPGLDGTGVFQMGNTTGVWTIQNGRVVLSGPFASWGSAEADLGRKTLTFRFRREGLDFEMVLMRGTDASR